MSRWRLRAKGVSSGCHCRCWAASARPTLTCFLRTAVKYHCASFCQQCLKRSYDCDINARWVLLKTASNRMGLIRLRFCQFSNLRMEIKRRPSGKMSLTPEDESVFHPSEHQSGMTVCPCVCVRVWGGHDPFQRKIQSERAWRKVSSIKPGLDFIESREDLSPLCLCLSDGF